MQMVHRRGDKLGSDASDDPSSNTSGPDDDAKKNLPIGRVSRIGGAFCFMALYLILTSSSGRRGGTGGFTTGTSSSSSGSVKKKSKTGDKNPMAEFPRFEPAIAKYDKCVVKYTPSPPKKEWDTKPLWLAAYPGSGTAGASGKGDIMKPLVNGITGLNAGAKFYHASSKILKRCKGLDETATCSNGHPVVSIGPEQQANNFYSKALIVIRNWRDVFPAYHNDKAQAYHGATEQLPVTAWRSNRDTWYQKSFSEWKNLIMTWKEMKEYTIGMYIQYEGLMDAERGPVIAQQLADLLQEAGFSVAPKEDIPCIWYQSVKDEYLRLKEFWKYTPGYTQEQRDEIIQELAKFQDEVANDEPLVGILKEYQEDVRDNTLIDIPAPKDANSS